MKNYWMAAGLTLNSAIIVINRFLWPVPDLPYLLCLILGIVLMLIGIIKSR